jgi:hypothetical protein
MLARFRAYFKELTLHRNTRCGSHSDISGT